MAPQQNPQPPNLTTLLSTFIHSTTSNISTFLTPHKPKPKPKPNPTSTSSSSTASISPFKIFIPVPIPASDSTPFSPTSARRSSPPNPGPNPLPSAQLSPLSAAPGPAFSGQVFSLCDINGTGLLAVASEFHIPFISDRTPEWMKKMFSTIIKNESSAIFRFFMDLGDAVTYVKRLNIPTGVVGACRLDSAYDHFKENPLLFQFVPNSKQVKEANKLLKGNKKIDGERIDGVPVFTAQNVDFAITTPEGIKWYTPYFFDKNFLDSILEDSTDQHFEALIQSRRVQRRGDVIDDNVSSDNFASEIIEESADSIWEPGEMQDMMDEIGQSGIPLSVLSKAAELQLSYTVDKMLLGNRWLRKATGIQPKFTYMVDSFEKRSAFSESRAQKIAACSANSDMENRNELLEHSASAQLEPENEQAILVQQADQSPMTDSPNQPWLNPHCEPKIEADSRALDSTGGYTKEEVENNPLLPRITLFGVPSNDLGRMTRTNVKNTMEQVNKQMDEEISKELEQQGHVNSASKNSGKYCHEDRDPFFVATFGDYFSNMGRTRSPRKRRGIRRSP